MNIKDNYTLLCDFYELTMGNGYYQTGQAGRICYFDVFFRSVPDGAVLPLPQGWNRSSTISNGCRSARMISNFCGAKASLPRVFSTI